MNINIKFGIGFESIVFGMVPSKVIQVLGSPDKINSDSDERDYYMVYYYNEIMTKLFFDLRYDYKLTSIYTSNPDTYVWNKKIISLKKSEIEYLLNTNDVLAKIYDDYDFFDTIFCEMIYSTFNFEYNKLKSV